MQYGNTIDGVWTPTSVEISIENQLVVDPLLNTATFSIRDQLGADPATAREIKFLVRDPNSAELLREFHYNWALLLGL